MSEQKRGFSQRFAEYRPSKAATFWFGVACVLATAIVGFTWGGWVTGSTASSMASTAADKAKAELAAEICVNQFEKNPDALAQQAALKKADDWDRGNFIEKGGWTTIPGVKQTVSGAADLCAQRLIDAKIAPVKAALPQKTATSATTHS